MGQTETRTAASPASGCGKASDRNDLIAMDAEEKEIERLIVQQDVRIIFALRKGKEISVESFDNVHRRAPPPMYVFRSGVMSRTIRFKPQKGAAKMVRHRAEPIEVDVLAADGLGLKLLALHGQKGATSGQLLLALVSLSGQTKSETIAPSTSLNRRAAALRLSTGSTNSSLGRLVTRDLPCAFLGSITKLSMRNRDNCCPIVAQPRAGSNSTRLRIVYHR